MFRAFAPAPIRALARRSVDAIRARYAWHRMLRAARSGRDAGHRARRDHVCLLAWGFPPVVLGGTYRPLALVRHGTDFGLSFTVISRPFHGAPSPAGRYLAEQVPSETLVARTEPPMLRPFGGAIPDLDGGGLNILEIWESATRVFKADRPDLIFATGPPFHTFVAGALLARLYRVPLVLEYRDEWTECPFTFVRPGRDDRAWEAECLRSAQLVIFTTRSQLEHQLAVFGEARPERCVVVPNGWEPDDHLVPIDDEAPHRVSNQRIAISFTGNLGDHTLPQEFLDCLLEATRLRPELASRFVFRFVGQKSPRAREQLGRFALPTMIEEVDQVGKHEVSRIQRESDGVLLLNGSSLARYVPGKLYEYLASNRPILVFGAGGEVDSLVRRLGAGPVVREGDARALVEALDAVAAWSRAVDIPPERKTWLDGHTRRALAERIVALLREQMRGGEWSASDVRLGR